VTAIVSNYAVAVGLPHKRIRVCQYAGAFCATCPNAESLPCVLAGGYHDCVDCAEQGCPCMAIPTTKRRAAYQEWKAELCHKNGIIDAKRRILRMENYRRGRTCSACGRAITGKGKTGMCSGCARRSRAGTLDKRI